VIKLAMDAWAGLAEISSDVDGVQLI